MRITGGIHKGRGIRAAESHRPTKDQVRLAVYNVIATEVEGASVLDLFAGTGSLGLEAWSRGAARVDFVEQERDAFKALLRNVREFTGSEDSPVLRCHREDALAYLKRHAPGRAAWKIILADPPYVHAGNQTNWADLTLAEIDAGALLEPGGILVLELKDRQSLTPPKHLRPFLDRTYGMTRVVMCRKDQ